MSKKRQALNAELKPGRIAFKAEHPWCMVCDMRETVDVHEIARGPAREECLKHPELLMAVCRRCHNILGNFEKWPPAAQLAQRTLYDLKKSVSALNEIRGRGPDAIEIGEVLYLMTH